MVLAQGWGGAADGGWGAGEFCAGAFDCELFEGWMFQRYEVIAMR